MYQVITTLMHGLRWQQNPSLVEITPSVQLLITLASYEDIYQILSTPRIILYVNSMLEQTNWIPLQFAVETLVALPAPDSGQPHIMNPTVFRKIGAMLEDPRPYVRAMAIRTCHRGKLDEDTTSAAVVMPALIEKISPLLADQSTAVQKSVFEFLAPVLQRASHGGKVGQATGSEIILQHIRSPSLFGDGSTVFQGLLTPVVHGPNSHFIAQTRLTLLNTLTGTDLGRLATLRALGYFATDSILRAEIFTEEIIHAVVLMFDQWALDIYVEAHQTIRNLANYDDVRPRIGTLETVGLLLAALSHNDPLVRILGVQTITDLGRYPDFRNTILTPVARAIVINLANDSNLDVCRVALQGLIEYDHDSARHAALGGYPAFEAYPAVSAFSAFEGYSALGLYSGPIIPKPFAIFCERLTREQPLAQIFAFLEVMASISTHGLMEAICTPQTVAFILKILAMVSMSGKMDQGAELVKFIVENGPLQSLLSTADSLAQILDLVTSFGINDHIIELIKALDTHEPSTAASLVNTIINAISRVSPNVRLSYLILVTTLSPLTTTLTFEHAEQVLRFIEDPDSSIHDSGWRLLKYFAPNEPFRKNISTTLLWESMLRLLHNRPAAMLDVLKVLAEYGRAHPVDFIHANIPEQKTPVGKLSTRRQESCTDCYR
ncbi:armadillo-type protein [Mycena metata]|uniref:Armadillo-type protein n=1 Tax=Mycena metata TaxID=1033252 RepID=A0AAD7N8Z1_9AGAR|nr:armadillo-type protein [Mycena metata]